jgi:aspartyl-tRNA(Asn)/glutamyl-tRNA(Gln) amidotransferase subunit B
MGSRFMRFETVIGVEVHAQLLTESKMFCGCSTVFGGEPNTRTCPVCLGLPGTLPVTNRRAVEFAVRTGLAVGAAVRERSIFARKNYFYPDLPKGYQISQYEEPLCEHGLLSIETAEGVSLDIRIRRIHLEEDAGKLVHAEGYVGEDESLVDYNRCGTPLMEIVTEPDLRSPKETHLFLSKLRQLIRWLGVCDGNMEEGSLRCDANVSLRPTGEAALGVKTELKNMNSFRGVEKALEFEIARQTRILESGNRVVQQTLLWDEARGAASPMRGKEDAHDYRYFPDPDLPPLLLKKEKIDEVRKALPELPGARKARWIQSYGLSGYDASLLSEDREVADYFEELVRLTGDPKPSANWVMGEVLRTLNDKKTGLAGLRAKPPHVAGIMDLIRRNAISRSAGKKVFDAIVETGEDPAAAVGRLGLDQVSDEGELESAVKRLIETNPEPLRRYLDGNEKLFGFFMGELMKATRGKANPQLANALLKKHLKAAKS